MKNKIDILLHIEKRNIMKKIKIVLGIILMITTFSCRENINLSNKIIPPPWIMGKWTVSAKGVNHENSNYIFTLEFSENNIKISKNDELINVKNHIYNNNFWRFENIYDYRNEINFYWLEILDNNNNIIDEYYFYLTADKILCYEYNNYTKTENFSSTRKTLNLLQFEQL